MTTGSTGRGGITLAVVSDDFGETEGNTLAALEAHRTGIVTDAAIYPAGEFFGRAAELAVAEPSLGLVVHLDVVLADRAVKPVELARIAWAVGSGALGRALLEEQFARQIRRVFDAGLRPCGVSFHRHLDVLPRVLRAGLSAAERFGLRYVRRCGLGGLRAEAALSPIPDPGLLRSAAVSTAAAVSRRRLAGKGFILPTSVLGLRWSGRLDEGRLLEIVRRVGPGRHDLMCHPGYSKDSEPGYFRASELEALRSAAVRKLIAAREISLESLAKWEGGASEHRNHQQA